MSHMKRKYKKIKKIFALPRRNSKITKKGDESKSAQLDFASAWPTKLQSAERAFVDEPMRTAMAEIAAPAY